MLQDAMEGWLACALVADERSRSRLLRSRSLKRIRAAVAVARRWLRARRRRTLGTGQ